MKNSFFTKYSHFKYQFMPFELINTLTTFQGYIIKIWVKKLNIFVIVYSDNILIYTEDKKKGHV